MIPKKFISEFCIESLGAKSQEMIELTSFRHDMYSKTQEYKIQKRKIESLIKRIKDDQNHNEKLLNDLYDEILVMGNLNYDAGYQEGMADVMTSIILNKAEITNVEYLDWSAADKENI